MNSFRSFAAVSFLLSGFALSGAQTPVEFHGALSVQGNQIVNQYGQPFAVGGNSFFWSNTTWGAEPFYNAEVVDWLKNDWRSAIVRASMGVEADGGYLSDPVGNRNRVITLVDAAIDAGLYVLIDWHSHEAEPHEAEAIAFFEDMATLYGDVPNVIYEPYNEPLPSSWSNSVKPYAEAVIAAIRAIDPDNLIVVGSPTWSQDVDVASDNPITGYENIAYSLHFYAGTHGEFLRDKARTALNNGIALMVTEWGTVNATGDGAVAEDAVDEWMAFLFENNITHLNWSVHDKDEGASAVIPGASPTGGWVESDLTESGTLVRGIIRAWNEAPVITQQPASLNTVAGDRAQFRVNVDNAGATVQWQKDGVNLPGETGRVLDLAGVSAADAGSYRAIVTAIGGGVTSSSGTLSIAGSGKSEFTSISTRGRIGAGQDVMIAGFAVTGNVSKTILVRVVGPGLAPHGVTDPVMNPRLEVVSGSGVLFTNDQWGLNDNVDDIIAASDQTGAFPLDPDSLDAAGLIVLPPGLYTMVASDVEGVDGAGGVALVEVYEVNP